MAISQFEESYTDYKSLFGTLAPSTEDILAQYAAKVLDCHPSNFDANISLFDYGLDSLHAIQLRNHLMARFGTVPSNFLFEYPTLHSMAKALAGGLEKDREKVNYQKTQSILHDYFLRIEHDFPTRAIFNYMPRPKQHTVLLTGATSNLGSFILADMIRCPQIDKVYCLIQGKQTMDRMLKSSKNDGIRDTWNNSKVEILSADLSDPYLGLTKDLYRKLRNQVTLLQCCDWLVDFNQPIEYFERECICGLYNLIKFAYRKINPIHVHAISSISATANSVSVTNAGSVPEHVSPQNPYVAMPMGYAQSKYIVEHIFNYLITEKDFPCFIQRLGQVCGDTTRGEWNTNEHYPATIIGGARMKMMPDLPTQVDWLPVDIASQAIVEAMINMPDKPITHFSHIVHPRRIPWSMVLEIMKACGMDFIVVSPQRWVEELRKDQSNPACRLLPFFERNWVSMATMPLWETKKSVLISASLGDAPVFSAELLEKSLDTWRNNGIFDISDDWQRCAGV